MKIIAYIGLLVFLPFLNEKVGIEVFVQNISVSEKSEIHLAFFENEDAFPDFPVITYTAQVNSLDEQAIKVQGLEPGNYIIAVYQDLDGNEELDKNWMGIPKEPYGFSNNIKPGITGLPLSKSFVQVPNESAIFIKLSN